MTSIFHSRLNTLRPRQDSWHFVDILNAFSCMKKIWISINISLKFVPRGPIHNIPSLVQIVAWCRPGDKPLSEPMMVSLLTHICVTLPQWVNSRCYSATIRQYSFGSTLFLMAPSHYPKQDWFIMWGFFGIHLRAISPEMLKISLLTE